jgi:hypothetical protein
MTALEFNAITDVLVIAGARDDASWPICAPVAASNRLSALPVRPQRNRRSPRNP